MKTISKTNEAIFSLVSTANDIQDEKHDFNTREGLICANIKVYHWLDNDDVISVCDTQNYSKKQRKAILKEFNENRLNNVYNHVCEQEITFIQEQYQGNCDISNYDEIFKVWYRATSITHDKEFYLNLYPQSKYYIQVFWDEAKKFDSYDLWKNHIIKANQREYKEYQKRNRINKYEMYQYGRSGGWLSICKESEIESEILADNYSYYIFDELEECYNAQDNHGFNQVINQYLDRGETKRDFVKNLKSLIRDHRLKVQTIAEIVSDIEASKSGFKSCLLSQLEHEIGEFLETEFNYNSNVTIQLIDGKVKTSLGVTVNENEFKTALIEALPSLMKLKRKKKFRIHKRVGNYFVEYAKKYKKDTIIKAGCHRFSLNNIAEVLNINPALN
jgi:hypothetical protein